MDSFVSPQSPLVPNNRHDIFSIGFTVLPFQFLNKISLPETCQWKEPEKQGWKNKICVENVNGPSVPSKRSIPGGNLHIKVTGIIVVPVRGINSEKM